MYYKQCKGCAEQLGFTYKETQVFNCWFHYENLSAEEKEGTFPLDVGTQMIVEMATMELLSEISRELKGLRKDLVGLSSRVDDIAIDVEKLKWKD
jgi:hypothetical protein